MRLLAVLLVKIFSGGFREPGDDRLLIQNVNILLLLNLPNLLLLMNAPLKHLGCLVFQFVCDWTLDVVLEVLVR